MQRGRRSRRPPLRKSASLSRPGHTALEDLGGAHACTIVAAVLEEDPRHRCRAQVMPPWRTLEEPSATVAQIRHACQAEEEASHRAGPPLSQRAGPPPGCRVVPPSGRHARPSPAHRLLGVGSSKDRALRR
jgi:hypothetical protein